MIKIEKLNKYYNKGKKNQIHVIDNTDVTLPDNGLVAILGPSGCGKTTLLNCIGGLDKAKSGNIYINNKKITPGSTYKADKIRDLSIGYIFQDYKLIDNMSVFDNVALVLKMIGLKDKNEIKRRVEFILDKVGMLRYRYRPCEMLSGGERQRVGIARAIVKNPDIILADEPTGNLDSTNSVEIMNIIKSISKEKLVILVTHERELAEFYASRVIEIRDGKITDDYENHHDNSLDYELDDRIYLQDFKNQNVMSENGDTVRIFSDSGKKLKLDVVVKNGSIFIKSTDNIKLETVDENSAVKFIDDHRKKIDLETIKNYNFNFDEISNSGFKPKYSSVISIFKSIGDGFKKLSKYSTIKKILFVGFLIAAAFIMFSVSTVFAVNNVQDKDFVSTNKNYLVSDTKGQTPAQLSEYEKQDFVDYIIPGNSLVSMSVGYNDYYQEKWSSDNLSLSMTDSSKLTEDKLICGRMPQSRNEIVVDTMALNKIINNENNYAKNCGIKTASDFLNKVLTLNDNMKFTIVGISDNSSPSGYVYGSELVNIIYNSNDSENLTPVDENSQKMQDIALFNDKITLKEGKMPVNDYETLVDISNKESMPLNKTIDFKVNGQKLKVVGYYTTDKNIEYYLVNNNTIKYSLIKSTNCFSVYTENKETSLSYFNGINVKIYDSYQKDLNTYKDSRKSTVTNIMVICGIILLISFIEMYLISRSSFLSRIKEIGVLRGIGVKKSDIYKMFFGETFAITTCTSLPGILLMSYILYSFSTNQYLSAYISINPLNVLLTILIVYVFNILVGLIPVANTIKKRPSEIMSRRDVD